MNTLLPAVSDGLSHQVQTGDKIGKDGVVEAA